MRKAAFLIAIMATFLGTAMGLSASIQATIMNFGWHLKRFNLGMMTALMPNPDPNALDSTCVSSAILTSDQLLSMLDFEEYTTNGFNFGIFME